LVRERKWDNLDHFLSDNDKEEAYGIKDCKSIFIYDKWGWASFKGESS
jgi:hypothetical protein